MPTYKDIFKLNLKYIEYLLAKTQLTHGYIHNISVAGSEIEQEVRRLLKSLLPQRFRITHGYIISAVNKQEEPAVSPGVDVIIVDTLVPHSIFIIDQNNGMEVVPIEAVVGIFEVKRTLNKESLTSQKGAINHLQDICETVGIKKDDERRFLPGGIEMVGLQEGGGYYSNPIIGIIGVDHEKSVYTRLGDWLVDRSVNLGMVDMIFSINGYLMCLGEALSNGEIAASIQTYRKLQAGQQTQIFATFTYPPQSQTEIVARALGFIVGYVSVTGGRIFEVDKYFFNESLFDSL